MAGRDRNIVVGQVGTWDFTVRGLDGSIPTDRGGSPILVVTIQASNRRVAKTRARARVAVRAGVSLSRLRVETCSAADDAAVEIDARTGHA